MENVRLVHSIERHNDLRSIVRQDLRNIGIKPPKIKTKKSKRLNQSRNTTQQDNLLAPSSIFGNYLTLVSSTFVDDCGFVPRFLVEAAEMIEEHCQVEGIFRKSGSINRQKELRKDIEEDRGLVSSNVHDVTGLVKQFFRELPDPLFTANLHDFFVRCYNLPVAERVDALLLMCLLLPIEHLSTLRFTMMLLSRLAAQSLHNKMDAGNLAVVLAPNIMHVNSRSQKMNSTEEKLLQLQTAIVELLIVGADRIGVVSDSLADRTALLGECFGTEDELDGASDDNTLEDSKDNRKKRRKRSSSLQGLVSSIGRGLSRLRRNSEGKNNQTVGSDLSLANDSQMASQSHHASQSQSLSVTGHQGEPLPPAATPVVRKRKNSAEEIVPFSATKRKAILDQLPYKSALGSTPFTPASTQKRRPPGMDSRGLVTPNHPLPERAQLAFSATPKPDKSMRKKLNLFNQSSNRKAKRKSGGNNLSCSNPLRKSSKTKHLFKRLSSSKEKMDEGAAEDRAASPPGGVPHSGSAMELSGGRSPRSPVMRRSLSSPSLHDMSSAHATGDITLNQGFIDPDLTMDTGDAASRSPGRGRTSRSPTRGRSLRREESYRGGRAPQPVRRSESTDGALRRGQPNKLSNGLMSGKDENVRKMRRSFDKSDISHPIPIIVPVLPQRDYPDRDEAGRQVRYVPERRHTVVVGAESCRQAPRTPTTTTSTPPDNNMMESSLLNVVLPPPSGFGDQSAMELDIPEEEDEASTTTGRASDEESEAGFSTISGGTVIHRPHAGLGSLGGTGASRSMQNYGSSVSVNVQGRPPLSLQPSTSVDSLISTGSEASVHALGSSSSHRRSNLDRSVSIDSGKGSLLDSAELRSESRSLDATFVKGVERGGGGDTLSLRSEDGVIIEDDPKGCQQRSIKSLSAEDLKMRSREKPASRSNSMHCPGSVRQGNIVPNLQISAETHRLLARAGFLDSSLPHNVKDVAVPFKSPQRVDGGGVSFSREDRSVRSFRLERPSSCRKERPVSGVPVSPVREETSMEQRQLAKDIARSAAMTSLRLAQLTQGIAGADTKTSTQQQGDVFSTAAAAEKSREESKVEEDVWVRREPVGDEMGGDTPEPVKTREDKRRDERNEEEEEEKFEERTAETSVSSAVQLKRAELRLEKHDSVTDIQASNAGRVAHNVRTINSSLDRSALDQSAALDRSNLSTLQSQPSSRPQQQQQPGVRKRGVSPVRIPSIFVKSRQDPNAEYYRQLAQRAHMKDGSPSVAAKESSLIMQAPGCLKAGSDAKEDRHMNAGDYTEGKEEGSPLNETRAESEDQHGNHCIPAASRTATSSTDNFCKPEAASFSGANASQGATSSSGESSRRDVVMGYSVLGVEDDLSCSLLRAIEDVVTPRRRKRRSRLLSDGARSPLHESTNRALSSNAAADKMSTSAALSSTNAAGDRLQLRTTKGLTPHRVARLGPKVAGSDRSPGKPVKRLQSQSPRSPHTTRLSPGRQSPQRTTSGDSFRLESRRFHEQY